MRKIVAVLLLVSTTLFLGGCGNRAYMGGVLAPYFQGTIIDPEVSVPRTPNRQCQETASVFTEHGTRGYQHRSTYHKECGRAFN